LPAEVVTDLNPIARAPKGIAIAVGDGDWAVGVDPVGGANHGSAEKERSSVNRKLPTSGTGRIRSGRLLLLRNIQARSSCRFEAIPDAAFVIATDENKACLILWALLIKGLITLTTQETYEYKHEEVGCLVLHLGGSPRSSPRVRRSQSGQWQRRPGHHPSGSAARRPAPPPFRVAFT